MFVFLYFAKCFLGEGGVLDFSGGGFELVDSAIMQKNLLYYMYKMYSLFTTII